jgi:hypothetical protein
MSTTYQQLLKQSYLNRLRNKKVATGNDLLLQLDRISEDYQKEVNSAISPTNTVSQLADSVDFFDEVNEYEDLEFVD